LPRFLGSLHRDRTACRRFVQERRNHVEMGFVDSLEGALWAFHHTANFREGCLKAAKLGEDADKAYGQLAGAFYGDAGISADWRKRLAQSDLIVSLADRLHDLCDLG